MIGGSGMKIGLYERSEEGKNQQDFCHHEKERKESVVTVKIVIKETKRNST